LPGKKYTLVEFQDAADAAAATVPAEQQRLHDDRPNYRILLLLLYADRRLLTCANASF